MKSTDNYKNVKGLAEQAARQYKADHIVFEKKPGHYGYRVDNGKIKGEKISYKELVRNDKKEAKKPDTQDKPAKGKTSPDKQDTARKDVL